MTSPRRIVIRPQDGQAFHLEAGEHVRVIDPAGQQVADMWAFTTGGDLNWISTAETRDINERLFPVVGEVFYGNGGVALLRFVENGSPSPHDMLFPACSQALYDRFGLPNHPNCRDNLLKALRGEGVDIPAIPDPVNLFQNSLPQSDGRLVVEASNNPPGGYVVLRAETDLLMVLTACSVDFHPTNGDSCTSIEVEIF